MKINKRILKFLLFITFAIHVFTFAYADPQDENTLHEVWEKDSLREKLNQFLSGSLFSDHPQIQKALVQTFQTLERTSPFPSQRVVFRQLTAEIAPYRSQFVSSQEERERVRSTNQLHHVENLISTPPKIFLDLGAGNGTFASAFASKYKLDKHNTFALDLSKPASAPNNVTWLTYDEKQRIPLPTHSVDLVTTFMVLHHVKDLEAVTAEVFRILKPGGQWIIRETDAQDETLRVFNTFMDQFFYQVLFPDPKVPIPQYYYAKEKWTKLFAERGFLPQKVEVFEPNNIFTPFYLSLKKRHVAPTDVVKMPALYRKMILMNASQDYTENLEGGDFYVFPSAYCPVGCKHCYFGSQPANRAFDISREWSEQTLENFLQFSHLLKINNLFITGGGDPFMKFSIVRDLIAKTNAKKVVIHTSGYWAGSALSTKNKLDALTQVISQNPNISHVTLRLSIDRFHSRVGFDNLVNIIRYFSKIKTSKFRLAFHTIQDDQTLFEIIEKVRPIISSVTLFPITASPLFLSNSKPDLDDEEQTLAAVKAFDQGRITHPALIKDENGQKRPCFVVDEKGNIELWNSAPPDVVHNLDDLSLIRLRQSLGDIIYRTAIELGIPTIEKIAAELSPQAVIKAKAKGSAVAFLTHMLENDKLRLFVNLRLLQQQPPENWQFLPPELQELIQSEPEHLQEIFKNTPDLRFKTETHFPVEFRLDIKARP